MLKIIEYYLNYDPDYVDGETYRLAARRAVEEIRRTNAQDSSSFIPPPPGFREDYTVRKAARDLQMVDYHIVEYKTYDQWRAIGMRVIKGQKSHCRDSNGVALFSKEQVCDPTDQKMTGYYPSYPGGLDYEDDLDMW